MDDLLAPSSLYRKSTCVFTPESLLEILQGQPCGLLAIDEFRSFLDGLRRDYNAGMRELFRTLYDCRSIHRKIRSAEFRVEQPCITMLSAGATGWFVEATKAGEIRCGFYPRLVMVPAWQKDRYLTRGAPLDRHAYHDLLKRLTTLRRVTGEMVRSTRLEEVLRDWAVQRQKEIDGLEHEAELASFYTRLERVAMKLAALIQLADDPQRMEISPLALTDALTLVGWLQDGLRKLFADEFTFSRDMQDRQKLEDHRTPARHQSPRPPQSGAYDGEAVRPDSRHDPAGRQRHRTAARDGRETQGLVSVTPVTICHVAACDAFRSAFTGELSKTHLCHSVTEDPDPTRRKTRKRPPCDNVTGVTTVTTPT